MAMENYSKLTLEFDKVTGAMKFAGQEAVSLQKQVRLLRQELTLGSYTDAQFKQIQQALAETEFKLKQTQLRGKDLFEQFGTLGGPLGEFSNRIDRSIKLLNALNKVTFDELREKILNIGALISGNIEDISDVIQVGQTGGRAPGQRETTGSVKNSADQISAAANVTQATIAVDRQAQAVLNANLAFKAGSETLSEYMLRTKDVRSALDNIEKQFDFVNVTIKNGTAQISIHDAALRDLTEAELLAASAGKKLIITEEGMVAADAAATASTTKLSGVQKILLGVLNAARAASLAYSGAVTILSNVLTFGLAPSLRIVQVAANALLITLSAFIGFGIGVLIPAIKEFVTGFAEMGAEAENLGRQLDAIKKVLNLDLADQKRRSAEQRAEMEKNNATSSELRKKDLKDAKQYYNTVTAALEEAREKQAKAQADAEKKPGFFGVSKEAAEQQAKNVEEAGNLVLDLEQKQKDAANDINVKGNKNIEQTTKEGLNNRIKAIDAAIEQQIQSERTNSAELLKLYKERNQITDYLDKDHQLTAVETQERARIQKKKINDAVIDDNLRVLRANADTIDRNIDMVEKGSAQEYELRRQLAKANRDIAMQEAKKDEKTRENNEKNANTKLARDLIEIDKQFFKDKMELRQTELNALYEGTVEFYDKERELEQESYRLKLVDAKNNAELIEALTREHKRKLLEIDAKELDQKAAIEKRKADTAMVSLKAEEVGFLESFKVIREANKQKFQDLTDSENAEYEAKKVRAKGNNEQLEVIEKEHVLRLGEIEVQRVQANQQINQVIIDSTAQFGNALSQISAAIMENAQGRNEAQFENTKTFAKGAVIIEKAAAIGQIWSNNAIANAKAVAAFPLTGGQPWVTINTVSAALSSVATAGAAAKAISEIENRKFESKETKMGSGRNYAMGGYIDGPRHSQGGVPVEAEGGEAIMTRGAVTAFAPLLSAINQMGGGTSFSQGAVGQAGYDFPTPPSQQIQQAQITKTYVVENELTTIQQRQARLKDLSTL